MAVHPDFLAASEAAEQSLDFLVAAEACAARGEECDARACLDAVAMLATSALAEILDGMKDDLAGVAEGRIVRHGPQGPYHYASAHEAVSSLWTTIGLLTGPVRSDLLDWLGCERSILSALRAGLCRERDRLINQRGPRPSAEPAAVKEPPPRLVANVECRTVTLDGETFDVESVLAVRWLKVLIDHPGEWIASSKLKQLDAELDGSRPHRLKNYLDPKILSLIESDTGKGSRLQIGLARP